MQIQRTEWKKWAETLDRFKLKGLTIWLLEAGQPLAILGAQALYFGQPFFGRDNFNSLAHLLEDETQTRTFAAFLSKDATS